MIVSATTINKDLLKTLPQLTKSTDTEIDFLRWNKLYPYALIIAEAAFVQGLGGTPDNLYTEVARFVLPIPPEQLSIQTPYAIQVTKTLGGVVEEHNADPFKLIAMSGTTGVNPLRAMATTQRSANIFGGIVQAAQNTASAALSVFGRTDAQQGVTDQDRATGYGQFRLLELFLKSYTRAKKEGNKDLRLLFVPFKEQIAYVVTPVMFNMRREAGRALKYRYDLQLRAWGEFPARQLSAGLAITSFSPTLDFFSAALGKFSQTLDNVRKTIANAKTVVREARAAVNRLLNVIREVSLAIREAMGAIKALILLPYQIIADCKAAFKESWELIKADWNDLKSTFSRVINDLNSLAGKSKTQRNSTPCLVDDYFKNPTTAEAQAFFGVCDISKLNLPPALKNRIDSEVARVSSYTNEDYARMRDEVRIIGAELSDALGASSAQYDATYQNVHPTVTRTLGQGDWDVLFAVNDVLGVLNALGQTKNPAPTTMDYVAGFASKAGVAFKIPVSKFAVPFPYDTTLEQLAAKYLKNPDRWIEIATLNGLREPYVDEIGFTLMLLNNGKLSEITVNSATNLAIGQPIWIQSVAAPREKRHIVNIVTVGPGQVVLTLDGAGDLAKYRIADNSFIQAFLPDTVNSHQLIYIPSDEVAPDTKELASIPGVDAFDDLLEVGGVDLMLTSDNDLAITPDGDCKIAYGLQNLIQRARVALGTPRGSLLRHPSFGLPIQVGMSAADLDIQELKNAVSDIFTSDPSFNGVTSVAVQLAGGTLNINLGLEVSGHNSPLSLNFQVRR